MKIAITSDLYYPMINGVAVFAQNLATGLAARGHRVLKINPSPDGIERLTTDKKTGVTTLELKSVKLPFYPDQIEKLPDKKELFGKQLPRLVYKNGLRFSPQPYHSLKKALDDFQPDVIHLQTAEFVASATLKYARKYDIPLVSTGHAYPDNITGQLHLGPLKRPTDAVLRSYMASFLKHSEYATMPTEMAINDLIPKNRKHFQVTVEPLSNGVDLSNFKPGRIPAEIREKYHLPTAKTPLVLYVGRIDPEKSIENVFRAFAQVLPKVPDAEFFLAGEGIARAELKKLAQTLGITEHIHFLGKVMPPDLMDIYRAGWLFATASETETQGIVLIEAAATGLPLVAVDAGAVREVCQDQKNGFLCKPGDTAAMSRAIAKLLTEKKLREQYSVESLKIAKNHDINHTLRRFEEIYHEAIQIKTSK